MFKVSFVFGRENVSAYERRVLGADGGGRDGPAGLRCLLVLALGQRVAPGPTLSEHGTDGQGHNLALTVSYVPCLEEMGLLAAHGFRSDSERSGNNLSLYSSILGDT